MDFDEKYALAMKELNTKKVGLFGNADRGPSFARLFGIKLRPARYRSLLFNLVLYSCIFLFISFPTIVLSSDHGLVKFLIFWNISGGLCCALYQKLSAHYHSLTAWEEL